MKRTWKKPALAGLATLAALGLAATAPLASRADSPYTTVSVTGFNSPIVQTTPGQAVNYVDANVQLVLANADVANASTYSVGGGLPDDGAVVSKGNQVGAPFQLGNGSTNTYVGNDALQLSTHGTLLTTATNATPNSQTLPTFGTLTLANPGNYSSVGVLWMSGYGPSNADVTFNYSTGSLTYNTETVPDWGANLLAGHPIAVPIGRIDMTPGLIGKGRNNGGSNRIFDSYFAVDPTQTLESITFTDDQDSVGNASPSNNGLMTVFAINGISAAPEPGETVALMLGGLGLLGLVARKRRANA